jgi:integrase
MKGTKTEVAPGVWRLRVYAGRRASGTPIQITKTVHAGDGRPGSGARTADRALAKMVAELDSGNRATGAMTVNQLLDQWLEHCAAVGRSPTTVRKYHYIADRIVRPELGRLRLTKLGPRDLDRLYAKLTAKGNAPATVRRVHALIGAALHQAERWELVDRNVARRAQPPEVRTKRVVAPSVQEVKRVLAVAEQADPTLAVMLTLAATSGARRGELCALRWSDLDWGLATLTIGHSVYEVQGGGWAEKDTKTHQERSIGLDEFTVTVLTAHRGRVEALAADLGLEVLPDGFLFSRSPVGAEPILPSVVTRFTSKVSKRASVDTYLHALRHFSATHAIASGFDPVTVGSRLGHADPSITLRVYAHALERRDRDLANALGKALAGPANSDRHPALTASRRGRR